MLSLIIKSAFFFQLWRSGLATTELQPVLPRPLKKEEMEEMNNLIGILAMVNRQPEKNDKKNLELEEREIILNGFYFKQSVKNQLPGQRFPF